MSHRKSASSLRLDRLTNKNSEVCNFTDVFLANGENSNFSMPFKRFECHHEEDEE